MNTRKVRQCWKCILPLLVMFWLVPNNIRATESVSHSLPPELRELQNQGNLTVKALWAWKLVPEATAEVALEFRSLGYDLLAANQEQIMAWLRQADDGQLQLTTRQREILAALLSKMRLENETVAADTLPAAPQTVETISADVGQTEDAVSEADAHADAPTPSPDQAVDIQTGNTVAAAGDSESPLVATPAADAGVAMYRDGVERTGVSFSPGPVATPVLLWKVKIGEGLCTPPVVAGGSAYFGSQDGYLYAVDLNKGEMKWKFWAEDWIDNSPAVSDGVVYFGNVMGDKSGDRHLFAVDAQTGKEKWKFKSLFYGVDSSPAILDGLIYFGANDRHLYALNALTGTEKWKFQVNDSVGTPAISDKLLLFASSYNFYALDLDTGEKKWSVTAGATITTSPAVSEGKVYFGSDDSNLYALDIGSGQEKWKFANSAGLLLYPPAVYKGTVYLGSFDNLYALDANTGQEKWKSLPAVWISKHLLFLVTCST